MAQNEEVVVTLVIRADSKSAEEAKKRLGAAAKELGVQLEDVTRKVETQRSTYDKMMRALDPVYAGMKRLEGAEKALAAEVERGKITLAQKAQALDLLKQKLDLGVAGNGRMAQMANTATGAIKLQSYQVANLGQQFQDVAVQLAGGQNPFLIAMQQGPQAAFAVGGFANAVALVGQAFSGLAAAARANPIIAALTAAAAVAAAAGTAYALLREKTHEAKIGHENYALAVQAAVDADNSATASAERLAAARKSEANFLVRNAQMEQEINLKLLESARKVTEGYIEAAKAMPEGSAARAMALAPLQRNLTIIEKQIGDVTMRMGQLEIASGKVNQKGVEVGEAGAHMTAYGKAVEDARKLVEKSRTATEIYRDELDKLNQGQSLGAITAAEYGQAVGALNNWLYEQSDASKAAADMGKRLYDEIVKTDKAMRDAAEADEKLAEQYRTKSATAVETYAAKLKELDRLHDVVNRSTGQTMITTEEYARAVENLNQWLQEQDPAFQAAKKAADDYAKELERVVGRTTDRMVDFGADAFFDVLEGRRDDFWASMVTTAKRAFAQMAAEALLRPIFLPIVQSVVGSAPGAFGLQGNPLGGFAQGAAQSAGSSLMGGNNPLSSLLNGVQNMFSPNNFIANAFPSIFGLGSAAGAAVAPTSALMGPGGVMMVNEALIGTGAAVGAGPLAAMAPFLPMLAIALPLLLSFVLGGKKSVGPNGNAIINFERDAEGRLTNPGGLAIGGLGADNGGDREYARKMAEGATKAVNTIVDRIGGRMTGMPGAGQSGQLELGYFQEGGKFFSIVGGTKAEFGSAEEAVADFARRTLQAATITGMNPDVQLALSKTVATSLEDLGKDIDFAYGFRRQVDLAAAGPGTRQAQELGFRYSAQDNASQQRLALRDFVADARRLFGDDSTQYAEAQATARNRALAMVGMGPDATGANAPLEGMAAQIAATRETFLALKETLIDTGLSAEEAQRKIDEGLVRTFGKLADEAEKNIADALLASESPAAAQAKALAEAQAKRRADLVDVQTAAGRTVDTSTLDRLSASERDKFLDGLDLKGLADVVRNLSTITEDVGEAMTLLFESRSRAAEQLDMAVLQAESPAAAQAKALAEAQAKRRTDANALGLDSGKLDRLDRLEAGAAFIGMTAEQLDTFAVQMREIGAASPGMRAALEQAYAFAEFVVGFGRLQVDIARWAYEERQAEQDIADAEGAAAEAKNVYIDALNREISTVTEQIGLIDEQIRAQEELKANFERLALSMRDARLGLLIDPNLSPLNPQDRLAEARSQFESIYARAQGGDAAAMEQLPDISRSFLEASKAFNASNSAYFADFSRVQEALSNTETIAAQQVRLADEQLNTLRGQREVQERQLEVLQAQLAEAQGQSTSLLTVAEAAEAWRLAEAAAEEARRNRPAPGVVGAQQKAAFDTLATDFQRLYGGAASQGERDQIYQAAAQQRDALLGAITDVATLQAIGRQYYDGNTTDSGAIFLRSRLYSLNAVPQFAFGGDHYGGLRLVGERGPELEATGPARYFSTDATMEMLRRPASNDGALLAAVRTMCQLLAEGNGISRDAAQAMVRRLDDLIDGQGDNYGSLAEERARAA